MYFYSGANTFRPKIEMSFIFSLFSKDIAILNISTIFINAFLSISDFQKQRERMTTFFLHILFVYSIISDI